MDTKQVFGTFLLALTCAAASAATPPARSAHPVAKKPAAAAHRTTPAVKAPVKPVAQTSAAGVAPRPVAMIGGMPWYHVTDGFALAKKLHKPIMVDVYTDWCGWCKVLDRETFPNPAVKEVLSKNFVLVKANAEDNADGQRLATQSQVDGFPTVMFFDSNGKLKAFTTGFHPPDEFLTGLRQFLGDAAKPVAAGKKPEELSVHPSAPQGTTVSTPSNTQSADPKPASEAAVSDSPKSP
jgi:thiol-disulfide isomerase/thioredoxin